MLAKISNSGVVSIHSFDLEIHITTNIVIYWKNIVLFTDIENAKQ